MRLIVAVLVLVASFLRLRGYADKPPLNADEYDWAWSGVSLIHHRVPTGWTDLWYAYDHVTSLTWQGNEYQLVTPYLDHPPLFSLLVGAVAWVAGERNLTDVNLSVIRLVPIGLSLLALVLTFQLVRGLLGQAVALVTIGLLALSPNAIILSRVTESEALLTIWLLIVLLALQRLVTDRSSKPAVGVLLACCALAPLTKIPGLMIGGAALVILLSRGDVKRAVHVGIATVAGFAIYILYGGLLGASLFSHVLAAHAERHTSWLGGYELLRGGLGDWWWGFGLAGLVALAITDRRAAFMLSWPVSAYVLMISISASPSLAFDYDWYRIPIYGLVYAGTAWLFVVAAREIRARTDAQAPSSNTSRKPT